MVRDPRAFLWDARASGDAIQWFLSGKRFDDYLADEMLRSNAAMKEKDLHWRGSVYRDLLSFPDEVYFFCGMLKIKS